MQIKKIKTSMLSSYTSQKVPKQNILPVTVVYAKNPKTIKEDSFNLY
jgi:hypothetical protein